MVWEIFVHTPQNVKLDVNGAHWLLTRWVVVAILRGAIVELDGRQPSRGLVNLLKCHMDSQDLRKR